MQFISNSHRLTIEMPLLQKTIEMPFTIDKIVSASTLDSKWTIHWKCDAVDLGQIIGASLNLGGTELKV